MIKELEIHSPDIHHAAAFYAHTFGLQPTDEGQESISILIGQTKLILTQTSGPHRPYHFAIDIPHNKLLEAYTYLQDKVQVLPVPGGGHFTSFYTWNAQSFYFLDNDGNLLELICRFNLPNSTAERFSPASLLHISEIGLVTDDVPKLMQGLQQQYGIDPFTLQPPANDFSVAGNENGLLVIARTGRPWFPSDIPAQHNFTRVVMRNNSNQRVEILLQ